MGGQWGLLGFAMGQAAYALLVLGVYVWEERSLEEGRTRAWPKRVSPSLSNSGVSAAQNEETNGKALFEPELLKLSTAMTAQSVVKHFLTEGDRLIVSKFSPLRDQGGYAVATNYGSLVARIIFQPIEETSRLFFSKSLSSPTPSSLTAASTLIHSTLLLYTHLSLVLLSFGPPYIPLLLSLLLPPHYLSTSAPAVLKAYCLYLPAMALNGFLEAFVSSVAKPGDLKGQAWAMGASSFGFIGAVGVFGKWGGGGMGQNLVYANVVGAAGRAFWGWGFLKRYFNARAKAGQGISARMAFVPPFGVLGTSALCGVLVRVSETRFMKGGVGGGREKLVHVGVGAVCFGAWVAVCFLLERKFFTGLMRGPRGKSKNA